MLLGYFQFVCFKETIFIDIITQQNWSNILSVDFSFEGFPNFCKIIDPLNFIIIGFRMQFVELKIDASSESSPCWLRHSKVILVYYFTCIIVIYHVKFLPFFLKLIFVSFSMQSLFPMFTFSSSWKYIRASLVAQLVKNLPAPSLISGSGRCTGEGVSHPLQYSWASLVAQPVENMPEMQET